MTRKDIESGAIVHPLEAEGLGKAPFSGWTAIRLPLAELARKDSDVAQNRRAAIAQASAMYKVDASRCGSCRLPADDLYVVVDSTQKRTVALCKPCLCATGDGGLIRKATHLDHEYARKMRRVTKP